jgi:hypothetical protein
MILKLQIKCDIPKEVKNKVTRAGLERTLLDFINEELENIDVGDYDEDFPAVSLKATVLK